MEQRHSPALTEKDLTSLINQRRWQELKDILSRMPAPEVADFLEELSSTERMLVFRSLPRAQASEVFSYLEYEKQDELARNLTNGDARHILADLTPDDRTALLEELPAEVTQRLLTLLSPEDLREARTLLGYPEESVGRLMTPDHVAIRPDWTIQQSLEHIRKMGKDAETVDLIFVIDNKWKLIDDLRLRLILLADPSATVESIMDRSFIALQANDDREEAVRIMKEYDRLALPVVDSAGFLLGLVTIDDVLDVAEEEATEDIQKMGGMEALDATYMGTPFLQMVRKRGGWLSVLFVGEMLTATVMGFFEEEIARAVVLALFIPLIISSGGNSGAQAASLIIRSIALQEVRLRDWWRVMRRELGAGLFLGGGLGIIALCRIWLWPNSIEIYGEHYILVGITVALSLVGVVLLGTLAGSMLPFLFSRLGFDPAVSSTPFVATIVDVTGIAIYFSVALFILRGAIL
jgi:magnesium transporter